MNALLSLIVCVAMLLGAGALPAVPTEQTALTVRNLYANTEKESLDLLPEFALACALGTDFADARITLPDSDPLDLRLTADGAALMAGGANVFTLTNAILRGKLGYTDEQQKMAAAVAPFLAGAAETLAAGNAPEDFSAGLFTAISDAASVKPSDVEIPISKQTFAGKSYETSLSFAALMKAFDALAEGEDSTAALMRNCLKYAVKADGTPCAKFSDLAPDDSSNGAPIKFTQARVNNVRYDRVSISGANGATDNGSFVFECVTVDNVGVSAVLTLSLKEGAVSFTYSGKLNLQGTLAAPKSITFAEDMLNSNGADEGTTDKRHLQLNAGCVDALWNVALNAAYSHAVGANAPSETEVSAGYAESADESGAVTGLLDLALHVGDREVALGFEIAKNRAPFEDAQSDCGVMAVTDAEDDAASEALQLDSEALNASIRALFAEPALSAAADVMGIDLIALPLFGEAAPEPTETPAPDQTAEPIGEPL